MATKTRKRYGILEMTGFVTRTYSDSGQVTAYASWRDLQGFPGITSGEPTNAHMQALKARTVREGRPVTEEAW